MPAEEPQLPHYTYKLVQSPGTTFVFETKTGLVYQVDFNPDPDLFGTTASFSAGVAELIIKVRQPATNKLPAADKLIAPTIAAIVTDFFRLQSEAVILYICDSSDGRQAARWRLAGANSMIGLRILIKMNSRNMTFPWLTKPMV